MRKAVVFTAFDRTDYLKQTLLSWKDVAAKEDYHFFFKLEPSTNKTRMINRIENFRIESKVNLSLIENPEKCGVLVNPWEALDMLFSQGYDFVILAEDDIEVSDDILQYFNQISENHKDDSEVLAVCASSRELWNKNDNPSNYSKHQAFSPLVWGTWKDRWYTYLRDTWDKDYSTGENGIGGGWDWNIALRVMPQNNLKCIYPEKSRSKHIGIKGVHMVREDYDQSVAVNFTKHNDYIEFKEVI